MDNLIEEITRLKKERNAVILAHNYQRPEIYDVADFVGDSLNLSKEAAKTQADEIVFCGVKFMAETAKILNPEKTVLLPSANAGCVLADSITAAQLREKKREHPDAGVVCYINSTAEVKAESDACCTSANALRVVESLPQEKILFVPDKNMASWLQQQTPKQVIAWDGCCRIHDDMRLEFVLDAKKMHPEALVLAHPECRFEVLEQADAVLGTEGMVAFAKKSGAREFIIATETGMLERLSRECPGKRFFYAPPGGVCGFMKATTLERVRDSLEKNQFEVTVPEEIAARARRALDKMLSA